MIQSERGCTAREDQSDSPTRECVCRWISGTALMCATNIIKPYERHQSRGSELALQLRGRRRGLSLALRRRKERGNSRRCRRCSRKAESLLTSRSRRVGILTGLIRGKRAAQARVYSENANPSGMVTPLLLHRDAGITKDDNLNRQFRDLRLSAVDTQMVPQYLAPGGEGIDSDSCGGI